MLWGNGDSQGTLFGAVYGQNLNAIAPKFSINTPDKAAASRPVGCIIVGGFAVGWSTHQDVYIQAFAADGTPASAAVKTNTDPVDGTRPPAITMLVDGTVVVSWGDAQAFVGVRARHFSQDLSSPLGQEIAVNAAGGVHSAPVIAALDDGGYVIGWQGGPSSAGMLGHLRIFNPDGSPSTADMLSKHGIEPAASTLAAVPQGRFACVHIQPSTFGPDRANIFAVSLYGSDGTIIGDVAVTPQGSATISSNPVIRPLPNGGLVVAWTMRPVPTTGQFGNRICTVLLGNDLAMGASATISPETAPEDRTHYIGEGPAGQDDVCVTPVVTDTGGDFLAYAFVDTPFNGQPDLPRLVLRVVPGDLQGV